jgi:ABC-2 type transport system permease protein
MNNSVQLSGSFISNYLPSLKKIRDNLFSFNDNTPVHPFRAIVYKEISDHVRSWRFIILVAIIALTCFGASFSALTGLSKAVKEIKTDDTFFFLRLFTVSDGNLPSFFVFISFLGPLLGLGLGFDAINSEHNRGTLSRVLAQPIHRDYLINAKFIGALAVICVMLFVLGFLVMGVGLLAIGIPPTAEEFMRIIFFLLLSFVYVAFWLNLSIFFSIRFRQPATSALSGIALWLFFTIFYPMIVNLLGKALEPTFMSSNGYITFYSGLMKVLSFLMPNQLFSDATTTLLLPTVRSLGPLTMEQISGAIPSPLPLVQSLMIVWPQVTGLIAATILCFVFSYISFMKKEIRSR